MATIVTVHGTNDTGPEDGNQWWQRGSYFEQHIRELVKAEVGSLNFDRQIWDGRNSEASRYKSAEELAERLSNLEKNGEPYCVIGHSHGGSVISHALVSSIASKKNYLNKLSKWISVGTPFITLKKKALLFDRLSIVGQLAYVVIAFLAVCLPIVVYGLYFRDELEDGISMLYRDAYKWLPAVLFFVPMIFLVMYFQPQRLKMRGSDALDLVRESLQSRWLPLRHAGDEAVQGLTVLGDMKFRPFPPAAANGVMAFLSIFFVPLCFVFIVTTDVGAEVFDYLFSRPDARKISEAHGAFVRVQEALVSIYTLSFNYSGRVLYEFISDVNLVKQISHFLTLLFYFVVLCFVGVIVLFVSAVIAVPVGAITSALLNRSTTLQIRHNAWGGDTIGEYPVSVGNSPHWIAGGSPPLPAALADEITRISDEAAANAIKKFRGLLTDLAFAKKGVDDFDVLSKYLTWKELIHTTYFHVPRFRKLVAYAIAASPGFRATDAFMADPDYSVVASWYAEITQPTTTAPAQISAPAPLVAEQAA